MKRLWIVMLSVILIVLITGCGAVEEENQSNNEAEEDKESVIFREIDITVEEDDVRIEGEVKSWNGIFYYHVLQGEDVIQEEEEYNKEEHIRIWTPFIIELSKDGLVDLEEAPHIVLYGKNKQEETINPNYIPIDLDEE